jgi:hypothetical protein
MAHPIHVNTMPMSQVYLDHSLIKYKLSGEFTSAKPSARREIEVDTFWNRDSFDIVEFLEYDGADFLNVVYRSILNRFPDHDGFRHYESLLVAGISREKIVGVLRYSNEGRMVGVSINGLKHHMFYRSVYGPRIVLKKLLQKLRSGKSHPELDNDR